MSDATQDTTTDKQTQTDPETPVVETTTQKPGEYVGCVKWMSPQAGFGFLTVVSEGPKKAQDIFVHHTGIKTLNSNYRSLFKGEYVQFDIGKGAKNDRHIEYPHQAVNITGIFGGPLMCDSQTANFNRGPPRYQPNQNPRYANQSSEWQQVPKRGAPVKNTAKYNNKKTTPT